MIDSTLDYFRLREQQEREAAVNAICERAREAHISLAKLHAERHLGPGRDAAETIDALMTSLHHSFGDNDLLVARRQQRAATGQALAKWTEIVNRLETRRE